MRAVIVYESVFGNTHHVAEAVASGLGDRYEVDLVPVDEADADRVAGADLLVVGGPTHAHGMAWASSKQQGARDEQAKGPDGHEVDEQAFGESLRDWFHHQRGHGRAAAFDTRFDGPPPLTGSAAKGIGRRLRHHGWELAADPESFLVDKENELVPGELDRARAWGAGLG